MPNSQRLDPIWSIVYRLVLLGLGIYAFAGGFSLIYFTTQSNLWVLAYLALAVILSLCKSPARWSRAMGFFQGACMVYISVTGLIYFTVLQGALNSVQTGILHLVIPVGFLVDWLLSAWKAPCRWIYVPFYLVYPILYLIWSIVTGIYPYFFLDWPALGIPVFVGWVAALIALFTGLGLLYTWINHALEHRNKGPET
jgi:hypothetical protein